MLYETSAALFFVYTTHLTRTNASMEVFLLHDDVDSNVGEAEEVMSRVSLSFTGSVSLSPGLSPLWNTAPDAITRFILSLPPRSITHDTSTLGAGASSSSFPLSRRRRLAPERPISL